MSGNTLQFNNIRLNKKEFHKSKQAIDLSLVTVDQVVVSDKFKHSDDGFKYFIGYKEGEIVKQLCIILPQMIRYIKYFRNGRKSMSFLIKDEEVWEKYEEIWNVIKNKLGIKFHSEPIYERKYLKAKVREFGDNIKTNFLGNGVPKENMHYTCIACITIDSVMKINKKNYLPVYLEECYACIACTTIDSVMKINRKNYLLVYLEECKYKIKKIQMSRLINAELELDSDSNSDLDSDSKELTTKLESDHDSE